MLEKLTSCLSTHVFIFTHVATVCCWACDLITFPRSSQVEGGWDSNKVCFCSLLMDPAASSSSASGASSTSDFELVSSHLHRLQLSFNVAESRLRVVEDRLDILERGQQLQESRLRWMEGLIARLRALFSWGR